MKMFPILRKCLDSGKGDMADILTKYAGYLKA